MIGQKRYRSELRKDKDAIPDEGVLLDRYRTCIAHCVHDVYSHDK